MYRVLINHCVFFLKFWIFLNCQFCCSAGVLPAWCVYTHWHHRGETVKCKSPEYFKIFKNNTIFNEHPVCEGRAEIEKFQLLKTPFFSFVKQAKKPLDYVKRPINVQLTKVCKSKVFYHSCYTVIILWVFGGVGNRSCNIKHKITFWVNGI